MHNIYKIVVSGFILAFTSTYLQAGFDFGECSGSGTFTQAIEQGQSVKVGDIPKDIEGLNITLTSDKDVDIQLFDTDNDQAIVVWDEPSAPFYHAASEATKDYLGTSITYSGYNGTDGNLGHEFIRVDGTTPVNLEMKAFGYRSGTATVDYSWTGKVGCDTGSGTGSFNQMIPNQAVTTIGEIPSGISNLEINLTAATDIDIQLFAEDGTAIVQWPNGLINGPSKKEIDYHGMHIVYSGYNGVDGQKGHEYIQVTNATTETLTMKAYGYQAGEAEVNYSWGASSTFGILKTGQTISYTDFDDGYYQKGEERRFTRDDSNSLVTDHVTHLLWQDNTESSSTGGDWQRAINYCDALNLGGYSDWRLPTRKELLSIVDYGRDDNLLAGINESIFSTFLNTSNYYHWTSTTHASPAYNSQALVIDFNGGYQQYMPKSNILYGVRARCVRTIQ